MYPSSNFLDDIAWGAAWMYQRTGEQQFLTVSIAPSEVFAAADFYILCAAFASNAAKREFTYRFRKKLFPVSKLYAVSCCVVSWQHGPC